MPKKDPKILFPDQQVLTAEHFTVAQDWEVPIVGFFVIASRRQVKSILELKEPELVELAYLQKLIRLGMRDVLNISEVYFFQNEDSLHGFHVWVFPRHSWMERFGRKIQSVRPIMDHAVSEMGSEEVLIEVKLAAAKIREYLTSRNIRAAKTNRRKKVSSNVAIGQLPLI